MFGYVKRCMKDFEFEKGDKNKPERLAFEVLKSIFDIQKYRFEGFFRKTFQNISYFWFKLDRK